MSNVRGSEQIETTTAHGGTATTVKGAAMKPIRFLAMLAVVALFAGLVGPVPVNAAAEHSTSPVVSIADLFSGEVPTPVGTSTLVRTDHGVTATVDTSGLTPGDVVTMWWVVFNNPEACTAGFDPMSMCGPPDVMNPATQASVLHATGRIVGENGTAGYGAHLKVGDTSKALIGPGLINPRGAEVILVLKTHGPKIPGLVSEMKKTFAGGCHNQDDAPPGARPEMIGTPGPNTCAEIQVSPHSP